ncbi:hypothetical protein CC78DRAFT_314733 [Lojkania enalia]|uniref:Uncharacterized protein n=1 Tax=Lojkania enalia TaxID=147567 RepID=A0A9P4K3Y3_9PLEO|nr:hypothetical protein CC78DRAFT_314733 [Didymosphaeria enalia]
MKLLLQARSKLTSSISQKLGPACVCISCSLPFISCRTINRLFKSIFSFFLPSIGVRPVVKIKTLFFFFFFQARISLLYSFVSFSFPLTFPIPQSSSAHLTSVLPLPIAFPLPRSFFFRVQLHIPLELHTILRTTGTGME